MFTYNPGFGGSSLTIASGAAFSRGSYATANELTCLSGSKSLRKRRLREHSKVQQRDVSDLCLLAARGMYIYIYI